MGSYILVILTTVALSSNGTEVKAWRSIGEFHTTTTAAGLAACMDAANKLGHKGSSFECLKTR